VHKSGKTAVSCSVKFQQICYSQVQDQRVVWTAETEVIMKTQGSKNTIGPTPTAERLMALADRVISPGALSPEAAAELTQKIEQAADRAITSQLAGKRSAKNSPKLS
jgi:hypothetical protein